MTEVQLHELLTRAAAMSERAPDEDSARRRILDAALQEAAAVGIQRLTVEDVVRRSGLSRMTVYRRYPLRDDIVQALILRETQRFLAAVAAGIEKAKQPEDLVAEAFVAAVAHAREHPWFRRVAETDPGAFTEAVAADDARILSLGTDFIAAQIQSQDPGASSQRQRWVADVCARLFITYIEMPPSDPDPASEAELRRFARDVLTPLVKSATR